MTVKQLFWIVVFFIMTGVAVKAAPLVSAKLVQFWQEMAQDRADMLQSKERKLLGEVDLTPRKPVATAPTVAYTGIWKCVDNHGAVLYTDVYSEECKPFSAVTKDPFKEAK